MTLPPYFPTPTPPSLPPPNGDEPAVITALVILLGAVITGMVRIAPWLVKILPFFKGNGDKLDTKEVKRTSLGDDFKALLRALNDLQDWNALLDRQKQALQRQIEDERAIHEGLRLRIAEKDELIEVQDREIKRLNAERRP